MCGITNEMLYAGLPRISTTIRERRLRFSVHCWRRKNEVVSDLVLWEPKHGKRSSNLLLWEPKHGKRSSNLLLWEPKHGKRSSNLVLWEPKHGKRSRDLLLWEPKHGKRSIGGQACLSICWKQTPGSTETACWQWWMTGLAGEREPWGLTETDLEVVVVVMFTRNNYCVVCDQMKTRSSWQSSTQPMWWVLCYTAHSAPVWRSVMWGSLRWWW